MPRPLARVLYEACGYSSVNNGSGSEEADGMLVIVFQMRLNKVSELIHNSTNHQNLDKASVSVHFQEIIDLVNDTILRLWFHDEYVFPLLICSRDMVNFVFF